MKATALFVLLAACAGSGGSGTPSAGTDGGVGGVSFGGQQDIGEFRGVLEAGGIPGPDTLDANGFFNEHYAPPPQTGCTDVLCLTPGVSVGRDWLAGNHQATLQISINTNVDPTSYPKQPLNLVVVVDHSGSMAEDLRLEKVKSGLHTLIDGLADTDRLAIVEFDDQVDVLAPFVQTLDRAHLHEIVTSLQPRGATDIFDGLQQGFDLSAAALASDRQNRVIFLSDGLATYGNTAQDAILAMADGYVERGIGLTTIGVGQDFDVALMRGLAEHGAGNFYFLEDASAATEVFQQELAFFVTPLALDIHIDAVAGAGYDFGEIVGSTLWQGGTRGGSMHVPAAFVASRTGPAPDPGTGGRRGGGSMLFVHLDPNGHNVDGKVSDLTLTYRLPGSGETITQTVSLVYPLDPSETPSDTYLSNPEMAVRYAIYNLFLGFRAATRDEYDFSAATAALQATRAKAAEWNATREDPDIAADITLIDEYLANLAANTTGGSGSDWGSGSDTSPRGDNLYACSTGGAGGGLPIALVALLALRRRRR